MAGVVQLTTSTKPVCQQSWARLIVTQNSLSSLSSVLIAPTHGAGAVVKVGWNAPSAILGPVESTIHTGMVVLGLQ